MDRMALALLLLLTVGGAQEPPPQPESKLSVTATEQVQLGKWIHIKVDTVCDPASVRVRVRQHATGEDVNVAEPANEYPNLIPLPKPGEYAFTLPNEGRFTVHVSAYDEESKSILDAYAQTQIGSSDPVVVVPDPIVPPPPTPGVRRVYLILESADDTPETSLMTVRLQSPSSDENRYLKSKGHRIWILDPQVPQAEKWVKLLEQRNVNLPAIVITDNNDGVFFAGSAPTVAPAVIELIKKHGG